MSNSLNAKRLQRRVNANLRQKIVCAKDELTLCSLCRFELVEFTSQKATKAPKQVIRTQSLHFQTTHSLEGFPSLLRD